MTVDNELNDVLRQVLDMQLGEAINLLENYLYTNPHQFNKERLDAIKGDYMLMTDYWVKGYDDPERGELYRSLLARLYQFVCDVVMRRRIRTSNFIMGIYTRTRNSRNDWSLTTIRRDLESFVSDVALLDLEPEHTRQERAAQVYKTHHQLMRDLFDYIWTSRSWSDSLAQAFQDILLSPTIDVNDQQLIVSAIMLSAMNLFDINKFRVLANVYLQAQDEQLRQRALVGWAFSLNETASRQLFPEERRLVGQMLADPRCCEEIRELQIQLVYCQRTESDNQRIRNEIMPELFKGNMFRVTRNGIEEKEDDSMEDILHPEESERKMEKLEESFRKMMDMQKQGSDIYFGGFSQMKRFPFFYDICNWFVPFYADHPDVAAAFAKFRNNKFLHQVMTYGPFCNSDKYSFVFAFGQVVDRLPQELREMLERGEGTLVEGDDSERQKPAYLRRLYLQDLYRFFRIFPQRSEFVNPFDRLDGHQSLVGNPVFKESPLVGSAVEMARFLYKQNMHDAAREVLGLVDEGKGDAAYHTLMGMLTMHQSDRPQAWAAQACYHFAEALRLAPDHEQALLGYARTQFVDGHYQEAQQAYEKLLALHPAKKSFLLNKAVCQTNLGDYEGSLKVLYMLNYDYPDDLNVSRVLAWTLTCGGKHGQAVRLYDQLLAADTRVPDDMLNYGYCLWFCRELRSAIGMFRRYVAESEARRQEMTEEFFVTEYALLQQHAITDIEIKMMLDAVFG